MSEHCWLSEARVRSVPSGTSLRVVGISLKSWDLVHVQCDMRSVLMSDVGFRSRVIAPHTVVARRKRSAPSC